ncbi:restriction endonuclease subunit S [Porphyromonas endodontalis]
MRFPQFKDEWKQTTLGELLNFYSTNSYSWNQLDYKHGSIYNVHYGLIHKGLPTICSLDKVKLPFIKEEIDINKYTRCKAGDLIIADASEDTDDVGKAIEIVECEDKQVVAGLHTIHARSKRCITSLGFKGYLLASKGIKEQIRQVAQGTKVYSISAKLLAPLITSLPSLAEQKKIASFLSLIDERIQSCSETITQMKSLRISFYRTISHQRKREWQNIFLRDILTERKENNSMHYDVYSVSVSRGIVNQIEHLGRSFAAKDTSHYNTVHFGDVVYTKSPTGRFPYGIVKQSRVKSAVAVSPLYGVYIPNNYYIGVVLNNFFESSVRTSNYLAPLIQKGAKNTMNITTQHFLDNKILLPTSSEEQKKMADYLILLDERIEVEEELLKQYEMQKKYLLRQMFI